MKNEIVVLITGCSTGIGRELCNILSHKGCTVVATARNVEALKDLSAFLKLPLDVTKKESIHSTINQVISKFHKIDILINNAGYSLRGALEEIDVNSSKSMFDVNVFGIINMVQEVIPEMRKKQSGKIINIGSISGKFVQSINGVYCASKFAVEALSDTLRLELHSYNIQTTVIEPGPMKTHFFNTLVDNSGDLMGNSQSCYSHFYKSDDKYRKKQKQADPKEAAQAISNIILKKRINARYKVTVPFIYSMVTYFPDFLREYFMKKR
ncbi:MULTISPECIES: SDR family oxidoreductase [Clostridium]|uniref:Oxidoreductase n=3 Tax=Clostridium TaxID=1485 RepID=D8GSR4_CLOLD|nr:MULTISPECIES: SDR family oxidoreductase [Clostridium]ADK14484.1 predicted short chain dehydrogenase [Clostridium ljungdahlii DSM 13528]AGY77700.1 SDR family oxidoreductase [Clostridium autoethanogenum DSM 10061]ALU37839.1 putative short chain dehydrogenase [Clostridium autoethanogenum DSM 10061]OAA88097.1 putative oxidoreductase [Clostridium ljungdahlii DSM 13528]OVY49810.1 putative oxidoreductase [Clostridium autoethanogenum]